MADLALQILLFLKKVKFFLNRANGNGHTDCIIIVDSEQAGI